jgi:hypothetical protein
VSASELAARRVHLPTLLAEIHKEMPHENEAEARLKKQRELLAKRRRHKDIVYLAD